jgi:hypothetical protein
MRWRCEHRKRPIPTATHTTPAHTGYVADYDPDDYSGGLSDADHDDIKGPKDHDNDTDNKTGSYYDPDDGTFRNFGKAAGAADKSSITALVRRYFIVAAARKGSTACSMLYSPLARAIPEEYGRPPGPVYLRGKTCAKVATKLFTRDHEQLQAYVGNLEVTGVRLDHDHGFAVLRFARLPGRQIQVQREHKAWKIDELLDRELP